MCRAQFLGGAGARATETALQLARGATSAPAKTVAAKASANAATRTAESEARNREQAATEERQELLRKLDVF